MGNQKTAVQAFSVSQSYRRAPTRPRKVPGAVTATCLFLAFATSAAHAPVVAQVEDDCTSVAVDAPPRKVLQCRNGLTVEAESTARITLRVSATGPRELVIASGAVLVERTPGPAFQILTPHAIASVRGTTFIVDVTEEDTDVFVSEGSVGVAKRRLPGEVFLDAGEGVDVRRDEPLVVKTWGAPRVDALLARFGR